MEHEFPIENDIVVDLIPMCQSCQFRTGKFCNWAEVETIDGENQYVGEEKSEDDGKGQDRHAAVESCHDIQYSKDDRLLISLDDVAATENLRMFGVFQRFPNLD